MEVEEEDDEDEDDDDDDTYTVDDYSYEGLEEDEENDNDDKDSEEDEEDDNDEDYDEEEDTETNVNISRKKAKSSSMHAQRVVTSARRNAGKAPLKIEAELEKIRIDLSAAGLLPPNAPYFISQVRRRKRQELYIPLELIRDHGLDIPNEMIIRSKDGKEFLSRISCWGDGRKIASNGCRAFCWWNFVKQDERCLCIHMPDNRLQVYVLRLQAGKWMPRRRV